MTRVVVTGCAGFIGSNLTEELLKKGFEVRGIDDFSTGRDTNIRGLDFDLTRGSINDTRLLLRIMRGADFVLHQAAIPSVPRSISNPVESNHANIDGTLNVLVCAMESGVKRVVFASSSSVYGNIPGLPKKEDMPPDPLSPYALTKYTGEMYCRLFSGLLGLETISLRYFNVFGPRQDPDSEYSAVIPRFAKLMVQGKSPTIFGDGEQSRDFAYISNVVEANLLSMKAPGKACGRAYNIACGQRTTLNQMVGFMNGILGTDIKPEYAAERAGDVKHSLADISLAEKFLNYHPKVFFKEGLEKTIKWFKSSADEHV